MQYEDHQRWLPYHVPTRACQEGRRTSVISFRTSNPTRIHQEVAQNKLHILCGIFNKKCLSASSQCRYSNILFIFNSFVSLVFYQSYNIHVNICQTSSPEISLWTAEPTSMPINIPSWIAPRPVSAAQVPGFLGVHEETTFPEVHGHARCATCVHEGQGEV